MPNRMPVCFLIGCLCGKTAALGFSSQKYINVCETFLIILHGRYNTCTKHLSTLNLVHRSCKGIESEFMQR
jgi:hypothetical protein